jgi:hypothetical protein
MRRRLGAVEHGVVTQVDPGRVQRREVSVIAPLAETIERDTGPLTEVAGITVPPSPESLPATNGASLLASLAARTGGRVLSLDDPGSVWHAPAPGGNPLREHRAVWYYPLGLALILFVLDIAARMGIGALVRRVTGKVRQA